MKDKDFWEKYKDFFEGLNMEKIKKFYYEFQNFFGDKLGDFINLDHGYDTWFLRDVIFPERRKYMQQKVMDILKSRAPISSDIISKASSNTKTKLNAYYASHSEDENRIFNYVANGMFFLDNYRSNVELFNSQVIDVDYFLNKLLNDEELLSELTSKLDSIATNNHIYSAIDVFEQNYDSISSILKK